MTAPRGRIADTSADDTVYGHLLPIVRAEQEWGNVTRAGFTREYDTWFTARFRDPLHVDRLLTEFDFPEHISVGRAPEGDTYVSDDQALVSVAGFAPRGGRIGPPRPTRSGLLARILGR